MDWREKKGFGAMGGRGGGIEIGMGVERRGPGARRTRCCTCREESIIRGFSNFNFRLWEAMPAGQLG